MKMLKQHYKMSFNARRAIRLLQLLQWESRSPAYRRTTLGIASREYFTKAYLRPLTEAGLIAARIRIIRIRRVRNTCSQRQGPSGSRRVAPL